MSVPAPQAGRHHEATMRRGVSFADTLDAQLDAGAPESAEAKFGKRLERVSILDSETPAAPIDNLPAWLMPGAPEGGDTANTEDLLEEFLQDDDMLNLEALCAKWRGVDDSEVEGITGILPEISDNLILGDKHIQEFLTYRRQLNEKHERKASVQRQLEKVRGVKALEAVAEDDEDESDSEDMDETLDQLESLTPYMSAGSNHSPKEASASPSPVPEMPRKRESAMPSTTKEPLSPAALSARKKMSIVAQTLSSIGQSSSTRRSSVATSPRLTRAGNTIVGQDEAVAEGAAKRGSADAKGRRTSVSVSGETTAPSQRGRRPSGNKVSSQETPVPSKDSSVVGSSGKAPPSQRGTPRSIPLKR